jgi:hypothetical protein
MVNVDRFITGISEKRILPEELIQDLEGILTGDINPDFSLPCRGCGKINLKEPVYDRDLGGPYCSGICLGWAKYDATIDSSNQ